MKKIINWFKTREWSKIITFCVATACLVYAIWSGIKYYQLVELAILNDSVVMPDVSLPITGITGLLGSILGYLSYQGVLKTSLNKHNLTVDKTGMVRAIIDNSITEILDNIVETPEESEIVYCKKTEQFEPTQKKYFD